MLDCVYFGEILRTDGGQPYLGALKDGELSVTQDDGESLASCFHRFRPLNGPRAIATPLGSSFPEMKTLLSQRCIASINNIKSRAGRLNTSPTTAP